MTDKFPGYVKIKAGESVDWKRILFHNGQVLDTNLFDINCQLRYPSGELALDMVIERDTSPYRFGCYTIKTDGLNTLPLVPQVFDCDIRFKRILSTETFSTKTFLVELERSVTLAPSP